MSAAAPLGAALALLWLVRSGYGRAAVFASIVLTPVLILLAPAPAELAVTIAVEAPIVWALFALPRADRCRALLTSLLANAFTQPLFHMAVLHLPTGLVRWRMAVAGGELLVSLVEGLIYLACLPSLRRTRRPLAKALGVSLAANTASALVGLLLPI